MLLFLSVATHPTSAQSPATDFFALAPLINQDAATITAALGEPASKDGKDNLTDFRVDKIRELGARGSYPEYIYTWGSGIEIYFDADHQPVLFLLSRSYASDRGAYLFGQIDFHQADEDAIRTTLGAPDREIDDPDYPGIDWYYDDFGLRFHLMHRYENGATTFSRRVVRVEIIPQRFNASKIKQAIAGNLYLWQNLHGHLGKDQEDVSYHLGHPQRIQYLDGITLYEYPAFGFLVFITPSNNTAIMVMLVNQTPELPDYSPFSGALPYPLRFTDSVEEFRAKVGPPDEEKPTALQITYTYNAGLQLSFSTAGRMEAVTISAQFQGFSN